MAGLADIEALAHEAVSQLPAMFRVAAQLVVIRVEDWPEPDMLAELGIDDPLDLTGLYDGVPLPEKSVSDPAPFADTIWLFRRPLLDELASRDGVTLRQLVSHVMVHELAHHFGWSDDDIAEIDRWWE